MWLGERDFLAQIWKEACRARGTEGQSHKAEEQSGGWGQQNQGGPEPGEHSIAEAREHTVKDNNCLAQLNTRQEKSK